LAEEFPEIGIKMFNMLESRLNQTLGDLGNIQKQLEQKYL
jgi:hypothetical protein